VLACSPCPVKPDECDAPVVRVSSDGDAAELPQTIDCTRDRRQPCATNRAEDVLRKLGVRERDPRMREQEVFDPSHYVPGAKAHD
jgi:hypothetical protein